MSDTTRQHFERLELLRAEHLLLHQSPGIFGTARIGHVIDRSNATGNHCHVHRGSRRYVRGPNRSSPSAITNRNSPRKLPALRAETKPAVCTIAWSSTVDPRAKPVVSSDVSAQREDLLKPRVGVGTVARRIRQKNADWRRLRRAHGNVPRFRATPSAPLRDQ